MSAVDRVLAHPDVRRLAGALAGHSGRRVEVSDPLRRAAVAVVLRLSAGSEARERGGKPASSELGAALELLLIKRAEYAGDPWSGHVALPGGRQEENDASLEATAIRETWEETAIDLETNGLLIGALDELQPRSAALPPIVIAPFVFAAESGAPMELSHEVAEAFWVPVSVFQDPMALREIDLELSGGRRRVRSFGYRSHEIWGITERILSQLLGLMGVTG